MICPGSSRFTNFASGRFGSRGKARDQSLSYLTAFINSSVISKDRLNCLSLPSSRFALIKSSTSNINRIATETTTEIIKQIINTEVNKSSVSAIVNDVTKRQMEKQI